MTQTTTEPLFGTLFPSTFLLAHHILSGGVHRGAAQECAAIAATHLNGLEGKTTVHPGAGFGADIWAVHMYDVAQAIGLEKSPHQTKLGYDIAFDNVFGNGVTDVGKMVADCPVAQALYVDIESGMNHATSAEDFQMKIRTELDNISLAIKWSRQIQPARPLPIDIRVCDITSQSEVDQVLGQTKGDAAIANFVLHTLVGEERSTSDALELLAPLVKPGGIVVLSLPSQVIEVTGQERDEKIRQCSVFHNPQFKKRLQRLQAALEKKYSADAISPVLQGKRPWRLISEEDVRAGSPSLEHVSSHLRSFMAPCDTERDVIAGLLMFEAVFSSRRPAFELAQLVRSVLLEEMYCENFGVGIHVQFHVLRRR